MQSLQNIGVQSHEICQFANTPEMRERRTRNALWGLFIGDALAMPAHWFYSLSNIQQYFDGGIRKYEAAPHPHPESFMVGMRYSPDVETANRLGRSYDILHEHVRFYETSCSEPTIQSSEQESEHGNPVPRLEDRFHYHHGLVAGENTLAAHLVRVLIRSVIRLGRYDPQDFLEGFIKHLTTPGKNRDPYTEIYIRRWFENYSRGFPPHACAELQRNIWSIGSHGGVLRHGSRDAGRERLSRAWVRHGTSVSHPPFRKCSERAGYPCSAFEFTGKRCRSDRGHFCARQADTHATYNRRGALRGLPQA